MAATHELADGVIAINYLICANLKYLPKNEPVDERGQAGRSVSVNHTERSQVMALMKCSDCGANVSDSAPACPACGRPNEAFLKKSTHANERSKGSGTKITVSLSSAALLLVGAFTVVWFVPGFEVGAKLQAQCQVDHRGEGSCQFTNTGWSPGSQCVLVRLVNKQSEADTSGPICSGRIGPSDSAERHVSILIDSKCEVLGGLLPGIAGDACAMDIENVGEKGDPSSIASTTEEIASSTPRTVPANSNASSPSDSNVVSDSSERVSNDETSDASDDAAQSTSVAPLTPDLASSGEATEISDDATQAPAVPQAPAGGESTASQASIPRSGYTSPALQALLAKPQGPSFDCSAATNPTAIAICGDTELSQLDRQMAILYSSSDLEANPEIRISQRAWIRQRSQSCGSDVACLRSEFQERIKQLQLSGSPVRDAASSP